MGGKFIGYWDFFAREAKLANAPLYVRLSEGVGGDEALQELAGHVRAGQPFANILFASVHFLLLRGARHPLRKHYPSLNEGPAPLGEDPFPLFADFCAKHREDLLPLIKTRVTNTNEVGRCGTLNAGFRAVAKEAGAPLHLIEVGPSAGLNLIWDRYRIRYFRGAEEFFTDVPDAKLTIDVELKGEKIPPHGAAPKIASRVGLELNPVDLSNPDDRDWLRALVFPDRVERFARLEKALAIYETARPQIRFGNALDLLPQTLARIPEHEPVCVYHSFVTYQFDDELRAAFSDLLTVAGLRRPIWRLSLEGLVTHESPLTLMRYRDGEKQERILAQAQPHGAWLEWLDPA